MLSIGERLLELRRQAGFGHLDNTDLLLLIEELCARIQRLEAEVDVLRRKRPEVAALRPGSEGE